MNIKFASIYALFLMVLTFPVVAYVGPGAGLGMLGSLISVAVVVLMAIVGLVVLPIRMMMKKKKKSEDKESEADKTDP